MSPNMTRRGLNGLLITMPALFAAPARVLASAENWPQRPVKFILPLGPGSAVDVGARLLADRLSRLWNEPVVIENRPGANGLIAIEAFLHADDDHTFLCCGSGTFTVHPLQYKSLPYSPADIVPIARISNTVVAVAVPASLPIDSLSAWVRQAKLEPGKFDAAVVQGITEFVFDYFVKSENLSVQKVPYRDIVQAVSDVADGRVQMIMGAYAILRTQVQAQRIKVIAVTSQKRVQILPTVPTAAEAGFPSLQLEGLVGLFGPKRIDSALVDKIADDVIAVVADPKITALLASGGQVPSPGGPAEFAAAVAEQRARVAEIAQALGVKPAL